MRRRWFVVAAALVALATVDLALGAGAGYAAKNSGHRARSSRHAVRSIEIRTVPVGPHLRFQLAGHVFTTGRNGRATVPAALVKAVSHDLRTSPLLLRLLPNRRPDGSFFRLERWYTATGTRHAVFAAIDLYRPVRFSLVSRTRRPISTALVDSFQMKRIDGEIVNLTHTQLERPVMLQASRVVPLNSVLVSKSLLYRIMDLSIGGNNLVHRAQQYFLPSNTVNVRLRLLFYDVRFHASDALFGFSIGSGIRLVYPNGRVDVERFQGHGETAVASLPRGTYHVSVVGPGLSPSSPVSVTRDHVSQLKVLSYLDIAAIGVAFLVLLSSLVLVRRPGLRRRLSPRWRLQQRRAVRRAA
jgi:hypothetical protein